MTERAKWLTVILITILFPVLLTFLYPFVGSSVNVLCMTAPIVATLFFGFKTGVVFTVISWVESVLVFSQIASIPRSEGIVRIFIPFAVTLALCFGADRLRIFLLQRRKAEKALRDSEERYRMIFEHSGDGIILLDELGVIVDVSPSVFNHSGYTAEDLLGKAYFEVELFSERAQMKIAELVKKSTNSVSKEMEVTGRNKAGERISLQLTLSRIAEHPASAQWICLLKNTTERRDMMEKLQEAQKMKAIGRLAGGIAHDINNILNAIIGSVHAHRHEPDLLGKSFEDLDNITSACNRGAQLTRNLLGFARKDNVSKELFSINTAVNSVLSLVMRSSMKDIRYDIQLSEPLPPILGDRNQIENALMNICLNAQDAVKHHGVLTISTFKKGTAVWVCVKDTGCGMDEETQRRVFEPFFTTKPVGKGTGLGLSMVYGVVQSHNGSIEIESCSGSGTTVLLSFPEASVEATAKPDSVPAPPPDDNSNMLESRTVLLVDDEPLVLRSGARMLRTLGCNVLSASGGKEALRIFEEKKADIALVILDLIMPEMDGTMTLEKLREIDDRLPVLLASGYTQEIERVSALKEKSACGFLPKPYHPEALLAAARSLLVHNLA